MRDDRCTLIYVYGDVCPTVGHLFLTGGAFLGHYQGKKDVDWYGDVLDAIGKRLIQWPFTSFHVGALAEEDMKRIHATGSPMVQWMHITLSAGGVTSLYGP